MCFGNKWGYICPEDWDNDDAEVICRQINHPIICMREREEQEREGERELEESNREREKEERDRGSWCLLMLSVINTAPYHYYINHYLLTFKQLITYNCEKNLINH